MKGLTENGSSCWTLKMGKNCWQCGDVGRVRHDKNRNTVDTSMEAQERRGKFRRMGSHA